MCGNPNVKESKWQSRLLTLLCKGLCELLVQGKKQHFAASNDLHDIYENEHAKMRSESSECTWNAEAMLIHLESYLEECAQKVWKEIG